MLALPHSSDWWRRRTCSEEVGRSAFSTMPNTPNAPKHGREKKPAFSSFPWHSLHRSKLLLSRRLSDIWGVGYGGVSPSPHQPHTLLPRANAHCTITLHVLCIHISYTHLHTSTSASTSTSTSTTEAGPIPPPPLLLGDHHPTPQMFENPGGRAFVFVPCGGLESK